MSELDKKVKEKREELIQEAKERGYHITYNEDGSIDLMEDKYINGVRILAQSWGISPSFDLDEEDNGGRE